MVLFSRKKRKKIYLHGRNRDTDIENRLIGTVVEGEGGTNWESGNDICALPRVKQTASESHCVAQWARRSGHPQGWAGRRQGESREGRDVYLWLILGVVRQKPTQHCKAITLQPKIDFLKNKI